MIEYPDDYNPIFEYNEKIQSGEIVACEKIKKVYAHVVENINNPEFEFEYNPQKAIKAIAFIEKYCKHSKGKWGGKPIILELWQKALLAAIFGMVHKIDGTRQYREVFLVVARKNGKSVLGSGVGLKCLVADNEMGAEVYSVATKKDQAKIVWKEAKRMIKKSKALKKRLKCLVNDIVFEKNESNFAPLCSDSDTQDGLNVHCSVIDELHAWKNGKPLYDVIVDGTSAREQPLILGITTQGVIREDICDLKYEESERVINGYSDPDGYKDERFLPVIYELDNRSEWTDENCWIKANPNLGVSKSVDILRSKVAKAKELPGLVKNLVCKDFNIRETSSETWLNFEDLLNQEGFDIDELRPSYCFYGADLSSTTDLTSAGILFRLPDSEKIYYESMYWLPEELLERRVKEDKIPYDAWFDRGLIRLSQGNKVDYDDVTAWFLELMQEKEIYPFKIGYDAWSAQLWVKGMINNFGNVMQPVRQGKQTLSLPMKLLKAELIAKNINYNNNPITKWCLSNVAVKTDINDNIQPHKTSNQRKRIDGFAAMLNAYVMYNDHKDDYLNLIKG